MPEESDNFPELDSLLDPAFEQFRREVASQLDARHTAWLEARLRKERGEIEKAARTRASESLLEALRQIRLEHSVTGIAVALVEAAGRFAKHGRVRTVPMPSWAKTALDGWATAAGVSTGAVLRRVDKGGRVGSSPITAQAVFEAVVGYARKAGLGKITPHDLRRTFSKLSHLGRAPLEQYQISLGHASIQTTERYLGLKQNLHDAPCDRLGLVGWEG